MAFGGDGIFRELEAEALLASERKKGFEIGQRLTELMVHL